MNSPVQDFRFAARMLGRNPGFTAVAVLTLALGIGAATAMFTVVNGALLRPFRYPDPDRIMHLHATDSANPDRLIGLSMPNFLDWREQSETIAFSASYSSFSLVVTSGGEPERIFGAYIPPQMINVLGVQPVLGNMFPPAGAPDERDDVLLLGYGYWQSRYGGEDVVGKTLLADDRAYTILGVLPPLEWPFREIKVYRPLGKRTGPQFEDRSAGFMSVLTRVKHEVSLAKAQAETRTIGRRLEETYPEANRDQGMRLVSQRQMTAWFIRTALIALSGAVGFVLLIACANVASLLLARASAREGEMAIRSALGASRGRVIRQLLNESSLLSALGSLLGLMLAWAGVKTLIPFFPPYFPRVDEIGLDTNVILFTVAAVFLTGGLFGLAPALAVSRPNLVEVLKQGRTASGSDGRNWLRGILIAGEISLALVLLTGSGLMVRSFLNLLNVDPGFQMQDLVSLRVRLSRSRYPLEEQRKDFFLQLKDRVASLPKVQQVSLVSDVPLSGMGAFSTAVPGRERPADPKQARSVSFVLADPSYFPMMGMIPLAGRLFHDEDVEDSRRVCLVDEAMAQQFWPDRNPVGEHIFFTFEEEPREVVGVVKSVKYGRLGDEWRPKAYIPFRQAARRRAALLLRTRTRLESVAPMLKSQVWAIDSNVPVTSIQTAEDYIGRALLEPRFYLFLFVIFAGLAVALAAVGIYGVISYSVSRRTHEIGVRMALGAQRGNVLRMVLRQRMTLAAIGLGIGLLASYWLTRFLEKLLFGVEPTDPLTFSVAAVLFTGVALLACYLPARRATKVDPMVALRYE